MIVISYYEGAIVYVPGRNASYKHAIFLQKRVFFIGWFDLQKGVFMLTKITFGNLGMGREPRLLLSATVRT